MQIIQNQNRRSYLSTKNIAIPLIELVDSLVTLGQLGQADRAINTISQVGVAINTISQIGTPINTLGQAGRTSSSMR